MKNVSLGRLEKINLIACWESEAGDFTPWLAQEQNIALLGADLPQRIKSHLNQLLRKHPEAIVPIVDGHCTGCGMAQTKSMVIEVHRADELHRCLDCTRYLYSPSEIVARERASRVYGEAVPRGIARFSAPSLMVSPLGGTTPEEVLGQLCQRMQQEAFVEDGKQLLELALQREAIINGGRQRHGLSARSRC